MCIAVFLWQSHPLYPFLLFFNRDEYHNRPTKELSWWGSGEEILGGRDELAGGTWLGCTGKGKVAFLTNVREVQTSVTAAKSRGDLPVRFLESSKNPKQFTEELLKDADQYHGFNLIVADICSKSMVYITNRPESLATEVSPGKHVLTNASLDTPWPKAQRLGDNFRHILNEYGEAELPLKDIAELLMTNTVKDDDESKLPCIYPPEREYQLSSIFVNTDSPLGLYGTRSTSALAVKSDGEVIFYERHLEEEQWKEHTISFHVEKDMH